MVENRFGKKQEANKRSADYRGLRQENLTVSETSEQRIRNQCVILKPVVLSTYGQRNNHQAKPEIVQDGVVSNRNCKHATDENRKAFQSKIPVLKGRSKLQPLNNNRQNADSSLSAADRRQKYHQSRLRCSRTEPPKMQPLQPVQYCRILPALPVQVAVPCVPCLNPKVNLQKLPKIQNRQQHNSNCPPAPMLVQATKAVPIAKTAPIKKDIPVTADADNAPGINSKKKKGLPGEFTHFPALCNMSRGRPPRKNTYVSSVPHLPPILPLPAPPPPSVSASLEQEVK